MHYQELDLMQEAFEALGDDESTKTVTFTHDELMVTVYREDWAVRHVRIESTPSPHVDELRELAYQLVLTLLSETTNNDACEVLVRELSAHFSSHDEFKDREMGTVIVDATVEDELS